MIEVCKHTDLELALLAIDGKLGNGEDRQKALGARYERVQALVNEILQTGNIPASDAYTRLQSVGESLTRYIMEGE